MRKKKSAIWLDDKENFVTIVSNSETYMEILSYYNLSANGNNYQTLKDRIAYEGLSIEHFRPNKARIKNLHKKFPIEELLVENSPFSRRGVKQRIIEENVIPYQCASCNNEGYWNGHKLSLQLEHINGVPNDNRLHNLCFLCPNCHSQTPTYAGKKKKVVHKCSECEKIIKGTGATGKCSECLGYERRKVERPSIEVVQKSVADIGYSATGRLYGVSDKAIRKWLK